MAGPPSMERQAIDWASRPPGTNSFNRTPSAIIGASPGKLGTAVGQQSLRAVLSLCNSPQMNSMEADVQFTPGLITADGTVTEPSTEAFLRRYMQTYEDFVARVLTILPATS